MKRIIIYIILVAATMHIALIYKNEAFLNIFYGQFFIILLLAILNIISIHRLEISIDIPETVVQIGKKIPVNITINNKGIFPTGKIEVKINSFNSYSGKKKNTKFYGNADGHSFSILKCFYTTKNPGNIEFRIKRVWSNDFLGILKFPVFKYDVYKRSVIVIPELYEVPIFTEKSVYKYIFENNEIRPYIPGDSFKNIHWKLSAKTDELMAMQKYHDYLLGAVFFLGLGTAENSHIKKCFIQTVLSISTSLIYNGCSHYICWYDTKFDDIVRFKIEKETDSYEIVRDCIDRISEKHRECTDIYMLRDLYARKYNMQGSFTFLALNIYFELYVNNARIVQYDYKDLKESVLSTQIQL